MPLHDFECQSCSNLYEAMARGEEKPPCPACGSTEVLKLISAPRIRFQLPERGSLELNPDQLRKIGRKPDGTKL